MTYEKRNALFSLIGCWFLFWIIETIVDGVLHDFFNAPWLAVGFWILCVSIILLAALLIFCVMRDGIRTLMEKD